MRAGFKGILVLAAVLIAQAGVAQADWVEAFDQFLDSYSNVGMSDVFEVFDEGISNGLDFDTAVDRAGTKLYCPEEYQNRCDATGNAYILITYVWKTGCRGYTSDCCEAVQTNCREVMKKGEAAAQANLTIRDQRELCVQNGCAPEGSCDTGSECKSQIVCQLAGAPGALPACDIDMHICYCATACPDGVCDYAEALYGNCQQDCYPAASGGGKDNDTDAIPDIEETSIYGTDPNDPDSDADGLDDWQEITQASDPLKPDTDGGGQCDGYQAVDGVCRAGPDPCPLDSNNLCFTSVPRGESPAGHDYDGDGINNNIDVCPADPADRCEPGNDPAIDANGDGISDDWARQYAIESPYNDPDNDGLTNLIEFQAGTNPLEADSDGDSMPDSWEMWTGVSDPNADDDGDGLTNLQEYYVGTDPKNQDSDGDGVPDGEEGLIPGENTTITVEMLDLIPRDDAPDDGIFMLSYGQTITQIAIKIKYSNGKPIARPLLAGRLIAKGGKQIIPLTFNKTTSTNFISALDYDVLEKNNEAPFIRFDVFAFDPFNKSGNLSTRFFVLNRDDEKFRIDVIQPSGTYAYGQVAGFDIKPYGYDDIATVSGDVFVEGSGTNFALGAQGDSLVGEYQILKGDTSPLRFIVYASGINGDASYESVRRAEVKLEQKLILEYLPDKSSPEDHVFEITYPNGAEFLESSLSGSINGKNVTLRRNAEGYYESKLKVDTTKEVYVEAIDAFGNKGRLTLPSGSIRISVDFMSIFLPMAVIVAIALMFFLLYQRARDKKLLQRGRAAERGAMIKRKKQLETMIADTKTAYYKKKVSEEYASRKIADYEEELKLVSGDLAEVEKAKNLRKGRGGSRIGPGTMQDEPIT